MDRDKQQFVDNYLEDPERYKNSPYLNDSEVINAIANPVPKEIMAPLGNDILKHAANYAMLGATADEIAKFFNITTATFHRWVKRYPEFADAIEMGQQYADAKVEQALYKRAVGWEHEDVHISNSKGDITITPVTKHYPGDVKAQIYWLNNRRPDDWKDKRSVDYTIEVMSPEDRKRKILEYQERLNINGPITIDQQEAVE